MIDYSSTSESLVITLIRPVFSSLSLALSACSLATLSSGSWSITVRPCNKTIWSVNSVENLILSFLENYEREQCWCEYNCYLYFLLHFLKFLLHGLLLLLLRVWNWVFGGLPHRAHDTADLWVRVQGVGGPYQESLLLPEKHSLAGALLTPVQVSRSSSPFSGGCSPPGKLPTSIMNGCDKNNPAEHRKLIQQEERKNFKFQNIED